MSIAELLTMLEARGGYWITYFTLGAIAFLCIYNIVSQTMTNRRQTKALHDIIDAEINARLRMIEEVDKLRVELEEARVVIRELRMELEECYSSRKSLVSDPITST